MKKTPSSRREFLKGAALAASALSLAPARLKGQSAPPASTSRAGTGPSSTGAFKLKYAPSLGLFEAHAGKNPVDQLKFMADQGFRAMFDNGLMGRPVADQEAIAAAANRLGLAIGPFVAYADFSVKTFVTKDKSVRELMAGKLKTALETAKRTGCKWTLVVPGRYDESLDWDYQTANVVENLKWCAGVVEPSGLVIVVEPLNPKDHPGLFLTKMAQADQICRAVASPCLKIIDDMYHQQITEGNIISNIDACWDEIAAYHIGDSPGRKEPGTGELNYRNIFKHLHARGFQGVLGMEHGKSKPGKEGEKAVIDAYRAADNF
ncbi:MAG: TIM barrel protein [Acidobacteriota bacterium]